MGSKRLKAIVIPRIRKAVPVYDKKLLSDKAKALDRASKEVGGGRLYKWGTGGAFSAHAQAGSLPIRNYTTNIFPEHEKMNAEYIRTHFEHHSVPCWACRLAHVKHMKVTEGPYAGFEGEEPEYESMASWGPLVGNTDPGAMVMLSNVNDRLGLDANEAGWTISWVMECYEKGIFTRDDLDGLDMHWGNVEGIREMLEKISRREGIGDLLAEGVKRLCFGHRDHSVRHAYTHTPSAWPPAHNQSPFSVGGCSDKREGRGMVRFSRLPRDLPVYNH
jgi:aldehyde:ferredoxin oxidoreductase